jgi:hypothetical protein
MSELASSCSCTSPWPLELCTEPKKLSMRTELDKCKRICENETYKKASTKIQDQITTGVKLTGITLTFYNNSEWRLMFHRPNIRLQATLLFQD